MSLIGRADVVRKIETGSASAIKFVELYLRGLLVDGFSKPSNLKKMGQFDVFYIKLLLRWRYRTFRTSIDLRLLEQEWQEPFQLGTTSGSFIEIGGRRWFSRPNCSQFISSPAMPQTDLDLLDLFDMFSYPFLRLSSRKEELVVGQVVRERELFIFLYCTQIWRGHCSSPSQPVFQVIYC